MKGSIYTNLIHKKSNGEKSFAVLIDPDKIQLDQIGPLALELGRAAVDYLMVGGSLMVTSHLDAVVETLKKESGLPVILFPGSPSQLTPKANALLYLSLISGRNPELLIGQHVQSVAAVKQSGLELLPTGYMLIDGGAPTTVSYISNTWPIPYDKSDIALCTALAGEMLGLKLIYMDAGSGAKQAISTNMITTVAKAVNIPLIIGGGILTPEEAAERAKAGADLIVVGNAIEKDPALIREIAQAVKSAAN
jgi:putative glycerol-1-phosphate prenyltransferase